MSNRHFHHYWQCQIPMATKTLNLILKQKWINQMKVIGAFNNTKSCKMTIQHHQFCKQHLNKGEQQWYFTKSQWKKFLHTFFRWIYDVKNKSYLWFHIVFELSLCHKARIKLPITKHIIFITKHIPITKHFSIFSSFLHQIESCLCHWNWKLEDYNFFWMSKIKEQHKKHRKRMNDSSLQIFGKNNFSSLV
jgi:hypothetical protein